ncbi:MAG: prepilin-type N-terminal cleavage/methylation domain-containing protein [Planctomycetes bacterium]|nr:prepilin-type N-terminal cleavage/methylation domain-containing protein [Planctomycetota bacterium]
MKRSFPAPPRLRGSSAHGFTLVEVLAAVSVLIIGFAGVIGLLYGSFVQGHQASDRNAAAIMVPEAIRQIELEHLITDATVTSYGLPAASAGMFVQTLQSSPESDKVSPYSGIVVNGAPLKPQASTPADMNEWPRRPNKPNVVGGLYYRARYRLEKHEDWVTHNVDGAEGAENVSSPFRGVYVLSICIYTDSEQDMSKAVQVSDPVVVYLRDKKAR